VLPRRLKKSSSPISSGPRHHLRTVVLSIACACILAATASAAAEPQLRVALPEGWSARQMADRVAVVRRIAITKRHVTPALTGRSYAAAATAARPPTAFVRQMKRPRAIEGFLFPDTYVFGPATTGADIVRLQLQQFSQVWRGIDLSRAAADGRTPYEVLIVASMVERETIVPAERRLVAAVIYNRLDQGMPLGIDATLRYGLGVEGTRPLTKSQLASNNPYNTRRFRGLPPTPIGNPGLASIRAAARPAAVDYLYYVRKPDKLHHFFTADEHEFCKKAAEYGYSC
jgi:UPF0755 protein